MGLPSFLCLRSLQVYYLALAREVTTDKQFKALNEHERQKQLGGESHDIHFLHTESLRTTGYETTHLF